MDTLDEREGVISPMGISYMKTASIWMKFISIVFLIMGLFMVYATIKFFTQSFVVGLIYGIATAVFVGANVMLLGMGTSLSSYAATPNGMSLETFFKKTKNYFLIWGIVIALYLLIVLIALATGGDIMRGFVQAIGQGM